MKHVQFYDQWYEGQTSEKSLDGIQELVRKELLKTRLGRLFAHCFLHYYVGRDVVLRDFLEANRRHNSSCILDLACGKGRSYFGEYGSVVGLDVASVPLKRAINHYDGVIKADASVLPLRDTAFDFVLSLDFFGHVPAKNKKRVLNEIHRVLKYNGVTAHVIETESNDFCFRLAKTQPRLFRSYFVEQIGGHFGLESPSRVVTRFQEAEFASVSVIKLWGPIWRLGAYIDRFDNEYKSKSLALKLWIFFCKLCTRTLIPQILLDSFLGLTCILQNKMSSVDNAQLLFLSGTKQATSILCKQHSLTTLSAS